MATVALCRHSIVISSILFAHRHENRFARRSRNAERALRAGTGAAEARTGPEAGQQGARRQVHGVLGADAARPQAGVRRGGASGAAAGADAPAPAKVCGHVVVLLLTGLTTEDTRETRNENQESVYINSIQLRSAMMRQAQNRKNASAFIHNHTHTHKMDTDNNLRQPMQV